MNMNHVSPSTRRRERAIDRILDATLGLVQERGVAALTMQEIAAAADYTAGALYRYFPSKGALLAELVRRELEALQAALAAAVAPEPPGLRRLLLVSESLLAAARDRPAGFALVRAVMADPIRHVPDDEAAHAPAVATLLGTIAAEVAAATEAGVLSPGDPAARALRWVFGALGILQLSKLVAFDARLAPEPLVQGLTRDLLLGWGADPTLLDREPS